MPTLTDAQLRQALQQALDAAPTNTQFDTSNEVTAKGEGDTVIIPPA